MKKLLLKYSIFLAIFWAITIFGLCATPGQYIPNANWLELLSFDKFVHASIFFILCTLLLIISIKYKQSKTAILIYFLISVLYGGLLEIMQAKCFSNRAGDWQDFFANSFGCAVALLLFKKLSRFLKTTN